MTYMPHTCQPRSWSLPWSSGTVLDLAWQYCTVSENRRAKAARETSCLPLLRLLSRMVVLALRLGGTREEDVMSPTGIPCLCKQIKHAFYFRCLRPSPLSCPHQYISGLQDGVNELILGLGVKQADGQVAGRSPDQPESIFSGWPEWQLCGEAKSAAASIKRGAVVFCIAVSRHMYEP